MRLPSFGGVVFPFLVVFGAAANTHTPTIPTDPAIRAQASVNSANAEPALETGPHIYLRDREALPVRHLGEAASRITGGSQPISMASGDIDADGIADLIVGYDTPAGGVIAIHRGNLDAFAPQSQKTFDDMVAGRFPSPFLEEVQTFAVPVRPDFVALGNFTGDDAVDLLVASRDENRLYVFEGNGQRHFAAPQTLDLPGPVTALAADSAGVEGFGRAVVATANGRGAATLFAYGGSSDGLREMATRPLDGIATAIAFGGLSGDGHTDAAILAAGHVFVLHASDWQLEAVPLPKSVAAIAVGSFVFNRSGSQQIAALAVDGDLQFVARDDLDPRPYSLEEFRQLRAGGLREGSGASVRALSVRPRGWKVIETSSSLASGAPAVMPILVRTRLSGNGADDVMILDSSKHRMTVVSRPDAAPGAKTFRAATVSSRPQSSSIVQAIATRVSIDARPGVIVIDSVQHVPMIIRPLAVNTYNVTGTADGTTACTNTGGSNFNCSSIRSAVLAADSNPGSTINIPNGTYTLTIAKVTNDFSGNFGALYLNMNGAVTIVGGSQNSTIIQAGTIAYNAGTPNGVDMVMAVNEDISPITNATASISNLTIQNGYNRGAHSNDGDGGCMEFDTGSSGNANLTLQNVTIQNCATSAGGGAGLVIFNYTAPATGNNTNANGLVTLGSCLIQGNSAIDNPSSGSGGGIAISNQARMLMSNSQVLNNKATQVIGGQKGQGGGIMIFFPSGAFTSNSSQTIIHASTISGNKAAGFGGGIQNQSDLLIDQGSIISNNVAGIDSNNAAVAGQEGGGLYLNTFNTGCPFCPMSTTLSKITITGNSASANGGGISIGNGSGAGPLTMSFCRLAGNTAPTGSNLYNNHSTATVTNNWWGTNAASNTIASVSATTTFDPFIVLTHTASPSKIRINQSTTLTADMSKDNHGSGAALVGNLGVLSGLPITFNNAVDGSISSPQATIQSSATATATFNAGGNAGGGAADAIVDQQTVTANVIVLQPPSIIKSFGSSVVAVNVATATTFTINNPNVVAINGSFTDTLPTNLVVATPPGVSNTCGGTVTATAGSGSISFSQPTLAVGTCTISVSVTSAVDNIYSNSVTIDSTDAGNGNTASATLTVINPPHMAKAFGGVSIPFGATTGLTLTVSSTNGNLSLSNISFTDALPSNAPGSVVVATPSGLISTCNGTATAVAGSSSVSLSGASLAPGASCTVSLNVQATKVGAANNSVTASDSAAGAGNTATAPLTVVKADSTTTVTSSANPSVFGQSVTFTATVSAVAPGSGTPTGTVMFLDGGNSIGTPALSGGVSTLTTSALAAGTHTITTSYVGDTNFNGNTGSLTFNPQAVEGPPSIAMGFNPSTIAQNATTSLSFTITNPAANVNPLSGVAVNDTLPPGLTVVSFGVPACGGSLITTAPDTIALSGASISANGQCQFSVIVTGANSGNYTNTTGVVTSTNGGTGNTASASLTVAAISSFTPDHGNTGTRVLLSGLGFTGTTSVTFNGVTASSFTVLSDTQVRAIVPSGATSGPIAMTTPSGTLTSPTNFTIAPQASRTFVSSTGSDANPCSVALPCRLFARALDATLYGGEIVVMDSAGYGPMTIDKALTVIAPDRAYGNITATGTAGIVINATPGDIIMLRGLTLNGISGATSGIQISNGAAVELNNMVINGFATGINASGAERVHIYDSIIRGSTNTGISISTASGTTFLLVDQTRLEGNLSGIVAGDGARVVVRRSQIGGNGTNAGVVAASAAGSSEVTLERVSIFGTNTALQAGPSALSIIRLSRSTIAGNTVGVSTTGSGSVASLGNNTLAGNGTDGTFSPLTAK